MVQVAFPVVPLTATALQPLIAVPFEENVTLPEGAIGVNETPPSVAVNVTAWFTADVLAGDAASASVAVCAPAPTVTVSAADGLPLKFASPPYCAAMLAVPGVVSELVVSVATPAVTVPVPILVDPL